MLSFNVRIIMCLFGTVIVQAVDVYQPSCDSIFCHGQLLHTVQTSGVFNDSKSFVDMKMKYSYNITVSNFTSLMEKANNTPSSDDVKAFVTAYFEEASDLDNWLPSDYNTNPRFLARVSDPVFYDFAQELIKNWPSLAKRVSTDVYKNPTQYSLFPIPNGFIIPGDRFKEYHYWDSYWIIRGLLISDMPETAKGMIENFFHLIGRFGFVPSGGRLYYTDRSNPPLLAKMALEYYMYSNDKTWLQKNIEFLNQELHYWISKTAVKVKQGAVNYNMYRYNVLSFEPRPELYYQDYQTAQVLGNLEDRQGLYANLKSASVSGWDLSSRWVFDNEGGTSANISQTDTARVIPVDLNAFLCEAFKIVSFMYLELGEHRKANYWNKMALSLRTAIRNMLWDESDGIWYDYDIVLEKRRHFFYLSNISPLWCNCFDRRRKTTHGKRAVEYLKKLGVLDMLGGVPVSITDSGQIWDFPNVLPPVQAMLVQALENSQHSIALWTARGIATKWVHSSMKSFELTGKMYDRYDALSSGQPGGGGEYSAQLGYGWSNGIALDFINTYYTIQVWEETSEEDDIHEDG